jgi:K+ transporter
MFALQLEVAGETVFRVHSDEARFAATANQSDHLPPLFRVAYTSPVLRFQIYIGTVNWFLLIAVLFIMVEIQQIQIDMLSDLFQSVGSLLMTITGRLHLRITRSDTDPRKISPMFENLFKHVWTPFMGKLI